jgi:hypothetical protein
MAADGFHNKKQRRLGIVVVGQTCPFTTCYRIKCVSYVARLFRDFLLARGSGRIPQFRFHTLLDILGECYYRLS